MYGAIFGDIIGSRFEFDRGGKTKKFKLFTNECYFTDDTVMTVAIADGLLRAGQDADVETIKKTIIKSMKIWGKRYPDAGYGGGFYNWLFHQKYPKPYNSYGNGSAMRVSAAGWLYDTLERTREVARATAEVTHNHPEGIKGAECTAAVIFLARTDYTKEQVKEFVVKEFGYDLSKTLGQLRKRHEHVETCQDSLPKALTSFFEGDSYEEVVRNAVSLGGDTDTLAAIAGAMAEAWYGIPVSFYANALQYLPEDIVEILNTFDCALGRESNQDFTKAKAIKEVVPAFNTYYAALDALFEALDTLAELSKNDAEVPTPMIDVNNVTNTLDLDNIKVGEPFQFDQDLRLQIDEVINKDGVHYIPIYSDTDEVYKGNSSNIIVNIPLKTLLEQALQRDDIEGVVINPYGTFTIIDKFFIEAILTRSTPKTE